VPPLVGQLLISFTTGAIQTHLSVRRKSVTLTHMCDKNGDGGSTVRRAAMECVQPMSTHSLTIRTVTCLCRSVRQSDHVAARSDDRRVSRLILQHRVRNDSGNRRRRHRLSDTPRLSPSSRRCLLLHMELSYGNLCTWTHTNITRSHRQLIQLSCGNWWRDHNCSVLLCTTTVHSCSSSYTIHMDRSMTPF